MFVRLVFIRVDTYCVDFEEFFSGFITLCAEQTGDELTFVSSPDLTLRGSLGSKHKLTN